LEKMNAADHKTDLILAQEICDELRSGNNEAILSIYNRYNLIFLKFIRKRKKSIDIDRATSILTDFWVKLLNAKAICKYNGLASLKNYLLKILKDKIIDSFRHDNRKGAYSKIISDKEHEIDGFGSANVSPEKDLMHKEKIKVIHETLLMLSDSSASDAYLVKMHLDGLDYTQMAEMALGDIPHSKKQLDKKINAIKKQFTRSGTGSLSKFKSCLERVMRKNNLVREDMLN